MPLILTMPDLIFDSLISALIPRKIYDFFKALISKRYRESASADVDSIAIEYP